MAVEIVDVGRIIPIGFLEYRLVKECLHKATLKPYNPAHFSRALAALLDYPARTKISLCQRSGADLEDFPLITIAPPERSDYCPDLTMEFMPGFTDLWIHRLMKEKSSDRYVSLRRLLPKLDIQIDTLRSPLAVAPRFYGDHDYFDDNVSPRRERTFFDWSPSEQAQWRDEQMAF